MTARLILASLAVASAISAIPLRSIAQRESGGAVREMRVPVGDAALYARTVGQGTPLVVLHGGPDFDHAYLLPEMDEWRDGYQLIY